MASTSFEPEKRRHELAEFLRSRRAQLKPEEVGLESVAGRRRVKGLRREEVAHLSRVSYSWYTRLEQGYDVQATVDVIDSIASALRLGEAEHRHLRRLAGLPLGNRVGSGQGVGETLRKLLQRLLPAPAYAVGIRSEYLAWNDALSAVFCDIGALPPHHRNVLWATFAVSDVRRSLVDWDEHARLVVGQFRAEAAAHPDDPLFAMMAAELEAVSEHFSRWWATHEVVLSANGRQSFRHPVVGLLSTDLIQFRMIDRPSVKVVVHQPSSEEDELKLNVLRGAVQWGAVIGSQ
ncbi:helix-turn-helix transcriptional regulator [Mycobacterium sp. pW049]|uniref:helix-turn-helix transcriptional regulator n=1 Tax=[Mycobacterium] bulgaricum TaxID=3238985 RepID=UPI00351B3E00